MSLTTAPITARSPERRVQELLNEWLKSFFTGQPHHSPIGEATFALCNLLFNQADLPSPQGAPQIHTVFTDWQANECWWVSGTLGTWRSTLANPFSGVAYGTTTDGAVEESVHGHPARRLPNATDIRWRHNGSAYVEETFDGAAWSVTRTFPAGTTALRWVRESGNYVEQANIAGTWTTQRTLTPTNEVWDGSKALVTVKVELSQFVRVALVGGDLNRADHKAREVAANLDELYRDDASRALLVAKGFRHFTHRSGPSPLPTTGYATRLLVHLAEARFFLPKEGQ